MSHQATLAAEHHPAGGVYRGNSEERVQRLDESKAFGSAWCSSLAALAPRVRGVLGRPRVAEPRSLVGSWGGSLPMSSLPMGHPFRPEIFIAPKIATSRIGHHLYGSLLY